MDSQGEGQKVKEKGLQYALEQGENKVLSSHLERLMELKDMRTYLNFTRVSLLAREL